MSDVGMFLLALSLGSGISIVSISVGAFLMCRAIGRGAGAFIPEPKGDVFTVETPDDIALFPDDVTNDAEEHVLKRANKFLNIFSRPEEKPEG